MGSFSYNKYYKPGKGVEKDEPEKRSFFKFFELFFRKFWRYVELNLIQFLVLLPVLLFLLATCYDYLFTEMAPTVVTDDLKTVAAIEQTMQTYAGQTVYGQVLDHGNLEGATEDVDGPGYVSLELGSLQEENGTVWFASGDTIVTFYLDNDEALPVSGSTEDETVDLGADQILELTVSADGTSAAAAVHTEASTTMLSVEGFNINVWTLLLQIAMMYYQYVPSVLRNLLLLLSCLAFGPTKAGITYVLRNFSQQQHAWLSDVWDKAKENWKQAMLFGIVDFVVLGVFVFNMTYRGGDVLDGTLLMVMKYVSVLVAFIYCIMRKYIYLMMVTVDLTTSALVKNAWLLTFLGAGRNVAATFGNGILWLLVLAGTIALNHMFEFLLPVLLFSFTGFINVSACYPLVDKYLVIPIKELQEQQAKEEKAAKAALPEQPAEPQEESLF
jgi:uncharacterized membrane protein YesL